MFHTKKSVTLSTLIMVVALILAACGAPAPTNNNTTASPAPDASPVTGANPSPDAEVSPDTAAPDTAASPGATTGENKLEIFSWWTNGGEADGLNAMFEIYKQQNPGVEVINATVAGGAGTNARAVLQTRLQGGQPPDSWQVHAGRETLSYVDQLEPLTQFFEEQGLNEVMPELLLEQLNIDGEIYTVPVNIHRSNMLWYNPQVFEENNLEPPTTMDEFFTVAQALQDAGITPLAVGGKDGFEAAHLFESVLLATFGAEDYTNLWTGDAAAWADPRVATAIDTMARMLSYANTDRSARSWSEAAQLVLDGTAGMTIMGDWAEGYFISRDAALNEDFGWVAAPGTEGIFMWLSDSFGLAKGAPHPEQARAWLEVAGSKEGQDAFNPRKGSIPARTDADVSLYDEYLQWSIEQFASNELAPSAVHGAATTVAYQTALNNALEVFSANPGEPEDLINALTEAVDDLTR